MFRNFTFSFFILCAFLCQLTFIGCQSEKKADLVIHNGPIYTMSSNNPTAEMVAVSGNKIVYVGSSAEEDNWIGKQTEVLDLKGKTMTPGFIESHGHIMGLGKTKMRLDLNGVANYQDMVSMVEDAVKQAQPGQWILGRGWHQSKWDSQPKPTVSGFQTHQALSKVSPDNPVFLNHASGHAGIANAKAMEIGGITGTSKSPQGGEIIKDRQGHPTGIFTENAMDLIIKHIPESTPEGDRRALLLAIQECLANGITGFRDAGAEGGEIKLYREFLKEGKLQVRLWVMLAGWDKQLLKEWFARGPEIGGANNFLTIRSVKMVADGALGSRGAWLLQPYSDRPGHTGHKTTDMDTILAVSGKALEQGFQVCIHAIGDRANREVLDQFEKAFQENPTAAKDCRFRIEHAQHLSRQDIPRFGQMGVIAAMQGIHMASDRPWAIERLGIERIVEGAYVWQKLLKSGAMIVNGTDTPVEPVNPIASFYASVTRQTLKGAPPGGYEPDQRMTREQALRSYTLDAAYAGFEEDILGSIEVGKLADFTIFSQDIMQAPADQLLDTQVEYTIVNGKIVYQRSAR